MVLFHAVLHKVTTLVVIASGLNSPVFQVFYSYLLWRNLPNPVTVAAKYQLGVWGAFTANFTPWVGPCINYKPLITLK